MDQTGSYAATAYNEDAEEEVLFTLEIKGQTGREMDNSTDMQLTGYLCVCVCLCSAPPKITSLSEVRNKVMLCISEGAPPPSVTWYSCQNSHR